MSASITRRDFLGRTAALGGGLVLGFFLPRGARRAFAETPAAPNAFLRIAPDDTITILLKHVEMGQGVATSLPMVVAEELDCDWSVVRVEHAPAAPAYAHSAFGIQLTGGSTSTWSSFDQMRSAGASARAMLVAAAAKRWGVETGACRTERGFVVCGEKRASYGSLAEAAAALPKPEEPARKDPKDWKLIGKPVRRLDGADKVSGKAVFGMDVRLPGMLYAAVARPPVFGGKVKRVGPDAAKAVPGVTDVVQIPSGVAVVAANSWAARQGVEKLEVDWEPGPGGAVSTAAMTEEYCRLAATRGNVAVEKGDADAAMSKAARVVEAEYDVPFLAHAPMEPLNCTIDFRGGECDVWAGTQMPGVDLAAAAKILGIDPLKARMHTPWLGGGFGRRANPASDFVSEAAHLAKLLKKPVKVFWSREDDIRGGYYRPMWVSRIKAGLDDAGNPVAWTHTLVGQSIMEGTPFAMMIVNGVDQTSVEGASNSPYLTSVPDHRVDLHSPKSPVTVLWWRSVGHTHTGFVVESFVDELAHAAGKDPLEFRRGLLAGHPRHLRALNLAAEKFGWGKPLPAGRAAGLAVHESFGSFVAQAAEVSIEKGRPVVHRVTCAIDCGPVVNPDTIAAQMQSGIVYGLSAALHGEITIDGGKVNQSNFHNYPVLRIGAMPRVEVHIVESTDRMGGVGEPGVPPIAPAVANAIFRLTGERLRSLPLRPAKK
jgi:isoquinoline 1-oxidoreductase beta subunit